MKQKKLKLRHILPIFIALFINVFLVVIGGFRTNCNVTLKGGLQNASNIVSTGNNIDGSYSTIYVISFDKSTIFQNFLCSLIDLAEVSPINENSLHFSDFENYKMGVIQHESSVDATIISAYNLAKENNNDININYSLESLVVTFYYENSNYEIGDEIIAIDGEDIASLVDTNEIDSGWLKPEVGTTLTINRNNTIITKTVESENDYIYCYPDYNIDYDNLKPTINISGSVTVGPSGGLLRALSLYDELDEANLANGLKIAGTGTISPSGNVSAIGGIKQKIYTAISNDVDIFICPLSNYEEALEAYNKSNTSMKLIPVSTLSEAVEALK